MSIANCVGCSPEELRRDLPVLDRGSEEHPDEDPLDEDWESGDYGGWPVWQQPA